MFRDIITHLMCVALTTTMTFTPVEVDIPEPPVAYELVEFVDRYEAPVEPFGMYVPDIPITPDEPEVTMSDADVDLISIVTMAEAEGECEEGQRLVIDTILNRMDSPHFPDTARGVIYQKNQFTSMWNGRADRCYVKDDIRQLVLEELNSRYNNDCVFFRTRHYSSYGEPLFQVGAHYFSSYE